MEFFIKKNATLPILKMQVVKDGRSDFNRMMELIESSAIFFSMVDIETGIPKLVTRPAGFVTKTMVDQNADPEYYVFYQFTNKDTKKVGRYEGQFLLRNEDGVLILPIRDKLYINIQESFIADDLPYDSCYVSEFPCCISDKPIIITTTTTHPCPSCPTCPEPTPTPTVTPTPTPTPIPLNDLTYLLIPNNDGGYELITGSTIILDSIVEPGSVIITYNLLSNEILPSGLTINFTQNLGLTTGGTLNIPYSVSILPNNFSGQTQIILNDYNFTDLDGSSFFTGVTLTPTGSTISSVSENTTFIGPTPTPSPTPTVTPTPNPSPTPTPLLDPPKILALGDDTITGFITSLTNKFIEMGYSTPNITGVTLSNTYDGYDLSVSNYDVVILYTNSFDVGVSSTFPNNLKNYIYSGGNLVTGTFLWNLYPSGFDFTLTPFVPSYTQTNDLNGDFTNITSHPITNNIPSNNVGFKLTNGMMSIQNNCQLISTFDFTGQPFIAIDDINYLGRLVGINSYFSSSNDTFNTILVNSLLWSSGFIDSQPILVSIDITPLNGSVLMSETLQLTATATFSDATTKNVTNYCQWSSSSNFIATVNNTNQKGLVTGNENPGGVFIYATIGSITGISTINVS